MTKRAVIITTSVLVGLMLLFTILFGAVFRVRDIKWVYGEDFKYKNQIVEIHSASKLKKNTSMFDVNRNQIALNIEKNYPYTKANVNISGFTSVKITLSNREELYYFVQEAKYYILDEDCKVLNITNEVSEANKYILLTDVFSATENTIAGEFLNNNYTKICKNLYNALYSNAMLEMDINNDNENEQVYFDRLIMLDVIKGVSFKKVADFNGKMDKLVLTTRFGVDITIIEPSMDLDKKVNMAFSALRKLQQEDSTLDSSGSINVVYSYNQGNRTTICEYKA